MSMHVGTDGSRYWKYEHPRSRAWARHRLDGPAIEHSDGGKEWWTHGCRHRDGNLPCIELPSGHKEWFPGDGSHVVEYANGDKLWYDKFGNLVQANPSGLAAVQEHRRLAHLLLVVSPLRHTSRLGPTRASPFGG